MDKEEDDTEKRRRKEIREEQVDDEEEQIVRRMKKKKMKFIGVYCELKREHPGGNALLRLRRVRNGPLDRKIVTRADNSFILHHLRSRPQAAVIRSAPTIVFAGETGSCWRVEYHL